MPFCFLPFKNKYFSDKLKLLVHLNEFHPQLKNESIMNSIAIVMREYKGLKIQYQQIINKEDIYEVFKSFKLGVYSTEFLENFINILHYFNCAIPNEMNYRICSQETFSLIPNIISISFQKKFYGLNKNNNMSLRDTLIMYSTLYEFCNYFNKLNQKQYNFNQENITILKGINCINTISKEIEKLSVIQKIEEKKEHLTLVDYTMHLLKKSETPKVENDITKINIELINSLFSS